MGTGVALRLWRAGLDVLLLEVERPLAVRRTVSFSEAVFEGSATVEEVTCLRAEGPDAVEHILRGQRIPLLVDPAARCVPVLRPSALVDAILAKRNTGTRMDWARVVVGLGPGFCAGRDVHAAVETNRGPNLGRVLWRGEAESNSGVPAPVLGHSEDRVLRAPCAGSVSHGRRIGDIVHAGDVVCLVAGVPVTASFTSLVRGLLRDGAEVNAGQKIGDLDPRTDQSLVHRVSDKSLAVAGGALEAVLAGLHGRVPMR